MNIRHERKYKWIGIVDMLSKYYRQAQRDNVILIYSIGCHVEGYLLSIQTFILEKKTKHAFFSELFLASKQKSAKLENQEQI